jgi:flagellar basal body-associated protein FliL
MKVARLLVLALALFTSACGDPARSSLERAAKDYWGASERKDYERMASYFFPTKVATMGGMAGTVTTLRQQMTFFSITSWTVDKVQIHRQNDSIVYGSVALTFESDRKSQVDGKVTHLKSETGMVAHSDDGGQTWKFVGVTPVERDAMLTLAPNLLQVLDIPKERLYTMEDGVWKPFRVNGDDGQQDKKEISAPAPAVFFDLPDMLVNLNSTGQRKASFLKLSVSLELERADDLPRVQAAMPAIIDNFQTYLKGLRVEDLRGSGGIYKLRSELLERVNASAKPVKVADVLFKEMLVQ